MVQPPSRKRNRKRKRKAAALSSSSSSSSDSSSESEAQPEKPITLPEPEVAESSSSSSSSSESDSDSEQLDDTQPQTKPIQRSRSPTPIRDVLIPSFLPSQNSEGNIEKEQELKDKFRKFWMSAVADGFKDDLEEIRKEPNLNKARLALLVDSLASGADVFAHGDVNEMDVVLQ